ncbi:MAG: hypothetical protein K9J12_09245 [Melioribacteraceae bacterium]|nr:hypothetical protein [Melioribacteraceae bacterium]MCF8265887.1 hypothetical protein [Melioribacteraceae bacterium]MCF8413436.1 hypothetical protein [Melioribacteraceae bacterium]MCF8432670.1 hypothetical protein [Melioribacteraceae bacterium]
MLKEEVISNVLQFVKENNGDNYDYYVGTSNDPGTKMFSIHLVQPLGGIYKYVKLDNIEEASETKKQLISTFGFDGQLSDGSTKSQYLYIYKKTQSSKE